MKRLGLVGVGAWGKRYIDTIEKRADCRVKAIARASNKLTDQRFNAPVCSDWRELLHMAEQRELDGLIVATTPDHQAEVVAAAIEARVPVLAEKPLGLTSAVSQQLLQRWRAQTLRPPVQVNYVHLWAPAFRELVRRVGAEGGATQVRSIAAEGCATGPFRSWSTLYDYGPHDCALLRRLLGTSAPMQLLDAARLPVTHTQAGAALFSFRLAFAHTHVTATLGNASAVKRRRLAVELKSGRTLVYDDTQPHPDKLTIDGQAAPVAATMPLDASLDDYLSRIERWQQGAQADDEDEGGLPLCFEVARMLDALAAAADGAPS